MDVLKTELTTDPLGRGYAAMTDAEVAISLNTVNRSRNRASLAGTEVLNAVDATEWAGLDATQKQTVWDIVHLGTINPFGVEATLMIDVFGAGSDTITALAAARIEAVSRAEQLGLGFIAPGHVENARY